MSTIRFYGTVAGLTKWRDVVASTVGKEGSVISASKGRDFFDVQLTPADRQTIQDECWYAESGTGETATGRPYRWNDCVSYEILK